MFASATVRFEGFIYQGKSFCTVFFFIERLQMKLGYIIHNMIKPMLGMKPKAYSALMINTASSAYKLILSRNSI